MSEVLAAPPARHVGLWLALALALMCAPPAGAQVSGTSSTGGRPQTGPAAASSQAHSGPQAGPAAASSQAHSAPQAGPAAASSQAHSAPQAGPAAGSSQAHSAPQAGTVAGDFWVEPPTLVSIGFEWRIAGDD